MTRLWIDLFEWVLKKLFPGQPVIRKRRVAVTLFVAGLAMAGLAALTGMPLTVAVGMSLVAVCLGLAVGFLRRLFTRPEPPE